MTNFNKYLSEIEARMNAMTVGQWKFIPADDVQKLLEMFRVCVETLKSECCCPGEKDYDGREIKCDVCETLAKLDAMAGRGE